MPKNRMFHAKKKYIDKKMPPILPKVYAALAIALWNMLDMPEEERAEAIETVFWESQRIWNDSVESGSDMLTLCEELTGIDVRN